MLKKTKRLAYHEGKTTLIGEGKTGKGNKRKGQKGEDSEPLGTPYKMRSG